MREIQGQVIPDRFANIDEMAASLKVSKSGPYVLGDVPRSIQEHPVNPVFAPAGGPRVLLGACKRKGRARAILSRFWAKKLISFFAIDGR